MPPKIIPVGFDGGVNLLTDARRIRDDQCVYAKNLLPVIPGVLGKRGGIAGEDSNVYPGGQVRFGAPIAFAFPAIPGFRAVVVSRMTDNAVATYDYVTQIGLGSTGSLSLGTTCPRRPCLVSLGDSLYIFPGAGAVTAKKLSSPNTLTDFAYAGTGNGLIPRGACIYRGRLVAWIGNQLVWSDFGAPDTIGNDVLAANGRALTVGDTDGDEIVTCIEVMLTAVGSPAQSGLLVLKEYGSYLITGEVQQTTSTDPVFGDVVVNRLSFEAGCVSHESVVRTPYGTIWTGPDDVWLFHTGQVPIRIGTNIRPALEAAPPSSRHMWNACYAGGLYRLSIPIEGQSPADFERLRATWVLDLRRGAPQSAEEAKWFGPWEYRPVTDALAGDNIGLYISATDTRPGTQSAPYTVDVKSDGTYLLLAALDAPSRRDIADNTLTEIDIESGGSFAFEFRGKSHDLGDPMLQKIYVGGELSVRASNDSLMYASPRYNDGVTRDDERTIVGVDVDGFLVDSSEPDDEQGMDDEFTQVRVYPDEDARYISSAIQLHLVEQANYGVLPGEESIVIWHRTFGGTSSDKTYFTVDLGAAGAEGTVEDFLTLLTAAFATRTGGTYVHNQALSRATAIPTLTCSVAPTGCSTIWGVALAESTGVVTAAQAEAALRIFRRMGFDTYSATAISVDSSTATLQGIDSVACQPANSIEFSGIFLTVIPIPRRPS